MMKIGVSVEPYGKAANYFGDKLFQKLASFGFSAVDYNISGTLYELYSMDDEAFAQRLASERAAAQKAGITIHQMHGPWRSPPRDATPEDRRERMEKMKRSIQAARLLGAKYWVIHPIMPCGALDLDTENPPKTWALNKEFFTELLQYAKEQDVTICLENLPMVKFSMANPQQILKFVKEMNDDHFKICLDTGHSTFFPTVCLSDMVRQMGPELKALHIHDNMGDRDFHLWPTKGIIDWPGFIQALKDIDFQGVFSLETAPDKNLEPAPYAQAFAELCQLTQNLIQNI
jgi:sugar phosphate isomerase/epimerase